ncbi:ribosomal protein S6 kinase 2 alpha-like [Phyllobates terribilis]|uniref:ribosomal protein S6 kinase 2 alpha-like n=1 Tax=Phyllobates terribilis TaxID=111132 RepID=UPI003CCB5740
MGPIRPSTLTSNTQISISGFTFHQVLCEGRYGKVLLASVPGRNIYKAIKIIDKRDNAEALQRERRILLVARDCPFLSHLCAAQQSQDHAYFIMEHLSGGSLESLIRMCKRLNINSVRFYTAELICGLQFLHGHGIAHRDIMLDEDGHIQIIDLGVSKDGLTASSNIHGRTGTFRYMAPEVLLGQAYNIAVDWWSLGIVVSLMSSGRFPFYNGPEREKICTSITSEKPKFPAWLGADLTDLLMNLLQKDPERHLGVSGNIRDHPFFETICWEELEQRRARPPFTPFPSCSGVNHLEWLENKPDLHTVSDFSFLSPSWIQTQNTANKHPNFHQRVHFPSGAGRDILIKSKTYVILIDRVQIHGLQYQSLYFVVLASDPGQNIYKAIKIIDKRDNAEALQRERRILLVARDCPFLSHLCAAQQSQDNAYFIMEHLSGGSLESLIRMCKRLNINSVRFYTAELIRGLQFLHGHAIAHRDIKLANIMLDEDGYIQIIDLGVAKDGLTASSNIHGRTGTLRYMAPDVLLGQAYNIAVDWRSLGIVVSLMSSGRFPFYNGPEREKICTSITSEKPKFPAWLGADLTDLLMNLLQKDPERHLGVSGNIRDHPFFETICWEELEQRRARPPFTPFPSCSGVNHLEWLENKPDLHPVSDFSFLSPSWIQ